MAIIGLMMLAHGGKLSAAESASFQVCVSNEKAGTITLIDGVTRQALTNLTIGKRPRGIHASSDGKLLYVALSGTPISGPPELDAKGNPIFRKDDDDEKSDHSADGIAVLDLPARRLLRKIPAGSDPEQFALSRDGKKLFISNEDVGTVSIVRASDGKVEKIVPVKREPEGVALTPDGRQVYVTCETGGEVFVLDAMSGRKLLQFAVGGRPRNVAFLPDGSRAYVPSESTGVVHVIDAHAYIEVKSIALPEGSRPMAVVVSRDGKKLYASTGRGGTVCVIDTASDTVVNTIKVGTRPWGLGLSPDGKFLFSANGPSNDVSVIDLATEKEVQRIKADQGPWGIEIVSGGNAENVAVR